MLVVVAVVGGVPVPVVDVVDMVPVRNRDVPTALPVHMLVRCVFGVAVVLAFVEVPLVGAMQMSVVDIVDVIAVRNRDVTAVRAVHMGMFGVLIVCRRHRCSLFPRSGCLSRNGHQELHTRIHYQVRIRAGS